MNVIDEIKKEFEIPGAFESWAAYRKEVTDLILESGATGSIALFGIGPANDIDLRRLRERFGRITLIDLDRESMERGLVRYGLQHCPKVELWDTSLSGVTMEDAAAFFETLYNQVVQSGRTLTDGIYGDVARDAGADPA